MSYKCLVAELSRSPLLGTTVNFDCKLNTKEEGRNYLMLAVI